MKYSNFKPLTVEFKDGQLVLIRHKQIVQSDEIGTFSDRKELGNKVREMGFKTVKFSQEALNFIDADIKAIKEAKVAAKAEAKLAKAETRAAAKQAKVDAKAAKAKLREETRAAKALAKLVRLEEKAKRIADRAAAKQAKLDAKALSKKSPKEIIEEASQLMAA